MATVSEEIKRYARSLTQTNKKILHHEAEAWWKKKMKSRQITKLSQFLSDKVMQQHPFIASIAIQKHFIKKST